METEKFSHNTDTKSGIRKLTLPDGFQVGLSNLDNILREVADLKLTDDKAIKKELLGRIKACNYVASGAENDYSSTLLQEYRRKFDESGAVESRNIFETKKHQPG